MCHEGRELLHLGLPSIDPTTFQTSSSNSLNEIEGCVRIDLGTSLAVNAAVEDDDLLARGRSGNCITDALKYQAWYETSVETANAIDDTLRYVDGFDYLVIRLYKWSARLL